ncbi:MAG: hypothetical protein FJX51_01605 [Alphaproteobacteria bacterium]|nr:hypothetical protein [Alphaproteobacteria bacterium]
MEHEVQAAPWLLWLQNGQVGQAMRQSIVLYPAVEVLHILGMAALLGSILCMDLRLMGAARAISATRLARHLLPVAIGGFCLAVPMGCLLFVTEAVALSKNPAFLVKLGLIALAGTNAAAFHLGPWRTAALWDADARPPVAARAFGAASVVLWLSVVTSPRGRNHPSTRISQMTH